MYASRYQNLYFPRRDVVTISVHTERWVSTRGFDLSLDLEASTRDVIIDFFPLFYPPEKLWLRQESGPCSSLNAELATELRSLRWMLDPQLHEEKGAGYFPGVPFITLHGFGGDLADKSGKSGSGLITLSVSTDFFTSVEPHRPQRNFTQAAYYKNMGVI